MWPFSTLKKINYALWMISTELQCQNKIQVAFLKNNVSKEVGESIEKDYEKECKKLAQMLRES